MVKSSHSTSKLIKIPKKVLSFLFPFLGIWQIVMAFKMSLDVYLQFPYVSHAITNIELHLYLQSIYINLFLGKKESILKATWPVLGSVDEVVIKSSAYLMEAAREFRLKLKVACLPPKAKKGQAPVKVNSCFLSSIVKARISEASKK